VNTDEHVLTVTNTATQTITACGAHAQMVFDHWNAAQYNQAPPSAENPARKDAVDPSIAVRSWSSNISQMFSTFFGHASTVSKDGDLDLFVSSSSGFVYGVIFHASHYRVDVPLEDDLRLSGGTETRMGRYCPANLYDGPNPCLKPVRDGSCETHGVLNRALALPVPGEWSFHS